MIVRTAIVCARCEGPGESALHAHARSPKLYNEDQLAQVKQSLY